MRIIQAFIWICCIAFLHGASITQSKVIKGTNVTTFYNVIAQNGADPWVYQHTDGWYYMTLTTGGSIHVWRSKSFTSWDTSDTKYLWLPSAPDQPFINIWAPEIHYINSTWYVYCAAVNTTGGNTVPHIYVLTSTDSDPFTGSFTLVGEVTDPSNGWAIDPSVFEHPSGQLYMIWSGLNDATGIQSIFIAEMSDPVTISSERVLISTPTLSWELNGAINEGPEVTIRNGVISLVYSASGSWTNYYCLGLLTASINSDPMDPTSWKKSPQPIFQSGNNILAPGHNSFTKSPDGTEDWIIYHTARYNNSGWTRQIRAQKFTWNANSTPKLGTPADPNKVIPIPSGDQVRVRYQAEKASLLNGPTVISDSTASGLSKVGNITNSNSNITFTIQCTTAGTYVIAMRSANGPAGGASATLSLSVNNGSAISLCIVNSGWDMWGVSMARAYLNAGVNTLTFTKGSNVVELDEMDIFLDG